jgi:hypothetical protein
MVGNFWGFLPKIANLKNNYKMCPVLILSSLGNSVGESHIWGTTTGIPNERDYGFLKFP